MNNPELVKNFRLEFNLTRFLIPAALLLLVGWVGWHSNDGNTYLAQSMQHPQALGLFSWMCGFGYFFTILWGTYLVSNSLHEEIRRKTWDFVRMSSLSPFKILIGKMLGAPSVVWVISFAGVVPMLVFAGALMIPGSGVIRPEAVTLGVTILSLLCWTIWSYAMAIFIGLSMDVRTDRNGAFSGTILVAVAGCTIGGLITGFLRGFYNVVKLNPGTAAPADVYVIDQGYLHKPSTGEWYDITLYGYDILLMILAFFAAWAVIGAWRALRKSLQYRDAPWAWVAFLVTSSFFLNGFRLRGGDIDNVADILYWPIFISILSMFFACLNEAGDIIKYKTFARHLAAGNYAAAFRVMPLWMISFALFVVATLISILTASHSSRALLLFVSLVGFIVRDLFVFHAISWTPSIRRPVLGMIVFAIVFYNLLPMLAATVAKDDLYMFYPLVSDRGSMTYWISLTGQIVLAGLFFMTRWKTAFGQSMPTRQRRSAA